MHRNDPRDPTYRPVLPPEVDEAVDWEIEHHLQERVDGLVAEGWDPAEARREAEAAFGDVGAMRRELHTMGREAEAVMKIRGWLDGLRQDLRWSIRAAAKKPRFTAMLVSTLAVGLGAGTAIFTVADAMLLRPLPYRGADRIVDVNLRLESGDILGFMYADEGRTWAEAADFLEETAAVEHLSVVRTDGPAEMLRVLAVTHDLDDLLGVSAAAGRLFTPDDATSGRRVAVLSHRYWMASGGDPDPVGATLELEGEPVQVVGVLRAGFKFPVYGSGVDLWVPMEPDGTALSRAIERVELYGRIPEGMPVETAQARADALAASLAEEQPSRQGWNVRLMGLDRARADTSTRRTVWMLAGAVGLLLLAALANGANLLVVRARGRVRELAVRRTLGASRGRVVGQLVVESMLLALLAGALALALASGALVVLHQVAPEELVRRSVYDFDLEGRVVLFATLASALSGLLLGLVPALHLLRRGDGDALRASPSAGADRSGVRLLNGLVVVEVALSVTLLVGAGLFMSSFLRLVGVDPGFEPEGLALMDLQLSEGRYPSGEERRVLLDRLEEQIERLPGVVGATVAMGLPPTGGGITWSTGIEPEGGDPWEHEAIFPFAEVGPDYLEVLGTRLVSGRSFTEEELGRDDVVVLDVDFARDLFGTAEGAPGHRFRRGPDRPWLTVVGVVEDLRLLGLDEPYEPYVYLRTRAAATAGSFMSVAVRTRGDAADVIPVLREVMAELDPAQPIHRLVTAEEALSDTLRGSGFLLWLLSGLAGIALLLGTVGVYGVLAAIVGERRREVGIRMALGADLGSIRGMVLTRGLTLAALGTVVGLIGALLLSRLVAGMLYEVEPHDPMTLAGVACVSFGAALLASWVPVVRATRVEPLEVLRSD